MSNLLAPLVTLRKVGATALARGCMATPAGQDVTDTPLGRPAYGSPIGLELFAAR